MLILHTSPNCVYASFASCRAPAPAFLVFLNVSPSRSRAWQSMRHARTADGSRHMRCTCSWRAGYPKAIGVAASGPASHLPGVRPRDGRDGGRPAQRSTHAVRQLRRARLPAECPHVTADPSRQRLAPALGPPGAPPPPHRRHPRAQGRSLLARVDSAGAQPAVGTVFVSGTGRFVVERPRRSSHCWGIACPSGARRWSWLAALGSCARRSGRRKR